MEYKGDASGGSNLGPLNPELQKQVAARIARLQQGSEHSQGEIPVDLVTTSGSGLDPHMSPAALYYQVARVAKARGLPEAQIDSLVTQQIERPPLGVLGEPVVNVLLLNLVLDELQSSVVSQARK